MKKIDFKVPGKPMALKRHRQFKKGNFTGTYDLAEDDKASFLVISVNNRPIKPIEGPIKLKIAFYFSRPKSHYRTGQFSHVLKDSAPKWHTSTPDTDNLVKFVCDAYNHIFWKDDSQICILIATKSYADQPFIHIQIFYEDP